MTDQRRDTSPTLAVLATLAAKNVPEFKWPEKRCQSCEGVGTTWGQLCGVCGGASRLSDGSPAALITAVLVAVAKGGMEFHLHGFVVGIGSFVTGGGMTAQSDDPKDIARALLVSLLLAHEVEMPNDE